MSYLTRRHRLRSKRKRQIRFRCFLRNTILDVLRDRNYLETDSDLDWTIWWASKSFMRDVFDQIHLEEWQRVNHFRNHYELTRKDYLARNIKRKKKELEHEGKREEALKYQRLIPTTYILPNEYFLFEKYYHEHPGYTYICKPVALSQGKGIFLFKDISNISQWKRDKYSLLVKQTPCIVQRYIDRPLLVGGKKFDMRIYVLVTSYHPLTVYVYREGFCRFSHHRYTLRDISNSFVHLTNVAIQKHSAHYDSRGLKWNLRMLRSHIHTKYGKEKAVDCFGNIQNLILRSLFSVKNIILNDRHCFELYGFDILIDAELKCWILEINSSPSLTASTPEDYVLKYHMLDDMLMVIDLEKQFAEARKKKFIKNFIGFDLVYKEKVFHAKESNLGYFIDRKRLNRKLMKLSSRGKE